MDKKTDQIFGFDYPDLDMSDEEHEKKQDHQQNALSAPTKKIKPNESIQKTNQAQNKELKQTKPIQNTNEKFQLPFFPPPPPGSQNKASSSWVPPIPVSSKNSQQQNQNYSHLPYQKSQYQNNRDNKQKKNTVYVKNIPRSFNTQQKLMTFFKNQGVIKQIKVNEGQQSAVIKFVKEQNAAKFLKSNKIIFNRSYIIYGQRQHMVVSQQQINDRIADEQGNVKKAEQTNMKVLKEKVSNQISQQIRGIYFAQNYLEQNSDQETEVIKNQLIKDLQTKIQTQALLETENEQKNQPQLYNENEYNWTLSFVRKTTSSLQRKNLFAEFLKYGPIINLDNQFIYEEKVEEQGQSKQTQDKKNKVLYHYRIRILFLSPKSSWTLFSQKNSQMDLQVEGSKMKNIFISGKLKPVQLKKILQNDTEIKTLANQSKLISLVSPKIVQSNVPELINFQSFENQQSSV